MGDQHALKRFNNLKVAALVLINVLVWLCVWDVVSHYGTYTLADLRQELLRGEVATAWELIGRREAVWGICVVDGVMDSIGAGALPSSRISKSEVRSLLVSAKECGGAAAARLYAQRYGKAAVDARSWLPLP